MTEIQKLEIRNSELREKLNDLGNTEDLTTEQRSEIDSLSTEYRNNEARLRALKVAEDQPTHSRPEDRELNRLLENSNVGSVVDCAMSQSHTDGEIRELQEHYHLGFNQIPLQCLEMRAATEAPGNVGRNSDPIIKFVFPDSSARFLGVDMPTVGIGEKVYPIMTNQATVNSPVKGGTSAETTGTFDAEVLKPKRLQASFFYSVEDSAIFAGMDSALRQSLSDSLSDGIDSKVLTLTDEGLLEFGTDPTPSNTADDFASYRAAIYDAIDGRYASRASEVKLLVGAKTYQKMSTLYRSNTADDSVLDSVMRISGGVKVSSHVPAPASNVEQAVVARGMQHRHAVCPIWNGVTIIPDRVTKADQGQVKISAIMLYNFKVVRADGFQRKAFKLA